MSQIRINKIVYALAVVLIAAHHALPAQTVPAPEGRRLRDIVAEKYPDGKLLIGATTGSWGLEKTIGVVMDREFSYVTPENDFKQSVIRSDPNKWNWSSADAWLKHIVQNNQVLRIHGPIAPQCSNWAKEDSRTAEELSRELDTFMTALCIRYNNVPGIKYLDVVNEVALSDGTWHHPKAGTDQWENPWLTIGQDSDPNRTPLYVKQAFAIANEYAPDLKLIFNNHCHPGTAGMEKVKQTVLYLRERGYRVDGLGWQGHVEVGWATAQNLQELREVIDWCQERDLEFHITEFDAWIMDKTRQTLEGQAYTYRAIMDVLLEKLDSLTIGWNTWHITDASGWKPELIPSLFDDLYQPKPAYYAFQLSLETGGDYTTPYDIIFKVRSNESGDYIEGCKVGFNQQTNYSDESGEVEFQSVTSARYSVVTSKENMNPFKKEISIYSDTTITLWLDTARHKVTHLLLDSYSKTPISGALVTMDTLDLITDLNGEATVSVYPGTYISVFSKAGYKNVQAEVQIVSDTLLTTLLDRTHATVKFWLKKGDMPLKDALVILENDSAYTDFLGICRFENLPVDSSYNYSVFKEFYYSINGMLTPRTDTTVYLELSKSIGKVEFLLDAESADAQNACVIFNSDSVCFGSEGTCRFYNIPLLMEYPFTIISDNYPEYSGSLFLENDTAVIITLLNSYLPGIQTHIETLLYPNPARGSLYIVSQKEFDFIDVNNASGSTLMRIPCSSPSVQIDISDLPGGYYWIRLGKQDSDFRIVRPFIVVE